MVGVQNTKGYNFAWTWFCFLCLASVSFLSLCGDSFLGLCASSCFFLVYVFQEEPFVGGSQGALCVLWFFSFMYTFGWTGTVLIYNDNFQFFLSLFFSVVSMTGFKNHRVVDISGLRAQRNYARQFQGALQCNFRQAFSATRYSTLLGVLGGWQIFICTWVALSYVWSCAWSSIEALMSGRLKDLLSVCEGNLRMESPNLI